MPCVGGQDPGQAAAMEALPFLRKISPPDRAHAGGALEGRQSFTLGRPQSRHHLHSQPCDLGKVAGPFFHEDRVGLGLGSEGRTFFLLPPPHPAAVTPVHKHPPGPEFSSFISSLTPTLWKYKELSTGLPPVHSCLSSAPISFLHHHPRGDALHKQPAPK